MERDAAGGNEQARALARASSKAAIEHYRALDREYPSLCGAPDAAAARSLGCNDEVLYYLALEAERADDLDLARKTYLELLQRYPQSRLVSASYLAFGEMFLADGEHDPSKYALAEQAYQKVVEVPPPENRLYGYAQYRLAQVYAKEGDEPRALAWLVKAIESARATTDDGGLGAAARKELVAVYARAGDPARARSFFSRVASGAELDELLSALERRRQAGPRPGP